MRFASDTNTNLVDIMESLYNFTTTSLADTPDDKFDKPRVFAKVAPSRQVCITFICIM